MGLIDEDLPAITGTECTWPFHSVTLLLGSGLLNMMSATASVLLDGQKIRILTCRDNSWLNNAI